MSLQFCTCSDVISTYNGYLKEYLMNFDFVSVYCRDVEFKDYQAK